MPIHGAGAEEARGGGLIFVAQLRPSEGDEHEADHCDEAGQHADEQQVQRKETVVAQSDARAHPLRSVELKWIGLDWIRIGIGMSCTNKKKREAEGEEEAAYRAVVIEAQTAVIAESTVCVDKREEEIII